MRRLLMLLCALGIGALLPASATLAAPTPTSVSFSATPTSGPYGFFYELTAEPTPHVPGILIFHLPTGDFSWTLPGGSGPTDWIVVDDHAAEWSVGPHNITAEFKPDGHHYAKSSTTIVMTVTP